MPLFARNYHAKVTDSFYSDEGKCYDGHRRQSITVSEKQQGQYIKLLQNEQLAMRCFLSPGLESRFSVESSDKLTEVVEHLQHRAGLIVAQNPWLCGYLKKRRVETCLYIPREYDLNRFLHVIPFRSAKEDSDSWEDPILPRTVVGTGAQIIDTDEPLAKLCVIYNVEKLEVLVTICCCHSVGEPNLLYKVWGMLNSDSPIETLVVERQFGYKKHPVTALKGPARRKFLYYFVQSDASLYRSLTRGHTY